MYVSTKFVELWSESYYGRSVPFFRHCETEFMEEFAQWSVVFEIIIAL